MGNHDLVEARSPCHSQEAEGRNLGHNLAQRLECLESHADHLGRRIEVDSGTDWEDRDSRTAAVEDMEVVAHGIGSDFEVVGEAAVGSAEPGARTAGLVSGVP